MAFGDRARIAQVVANLLSNAIKYSPDGGDVGVAATCTDGLVRVAVSDEGLGIPAAAQAHVFEKFFRVERGAAARIGGTGLGLALAHEIVLAHGGRMGFESAEGDGLAVLVHAADRRERAVALPAPGPYDRRHLPPAHRRARSFRSRCPQRRTPPGRRRGAVGVVAVTALAAPCAPRAPPRRAAARRPRATPRPTARRLRRPPPVTAARTADRPARLAGRAARRRPAAAAASPARCRRSHRAHVRRRAAPARRSTGCAARHPRAASVVTQRRLSDLE